MIINPWIFYLINTISNFKTILLVILIVLAICGFVLLLFLLEEYDLLEDDTQKSVKKIGKRIFLGTVISLSLLIFLPSKETSYQMLIAKYVTGENIEIVKNEVTEIVDYICEKLDE